jgi:hypothetical protein
MTHTLCQIICMGRRTSFLGTCGHGMCEPHDVSEEWLFLRESRVALIFDN